MGSRTAESPRGAPCTTSAAFQEQRSKGARVVTAFRPITAEWASWDFW